MGQAPVWWRALRLSLVYAVLSAVWIYSSDQLLGLFVKDPVRMAWIATWKGWAFVLVTSGVLYLLVRRLLSEGRAAEEGARGSRTAERSPSDGGATDTGWALWPPVVVFALLAAAIATMGVVLFRQEKETLRKNQETVLEAVAGQKAGRIGSFVAERERNALALSEDELLASLVLSWLRGGSDPAAAERQILHLLEVRRRSFGCRSLALLDEKLEPRLRAGPGGPLPARIALAAREALRARAAQFADITSNPAGGPSAALALSFVAPLLAERNGVRSPAGVVVLDFDPASELFPLVAAWPASLARARTFLVRREGNEVVYLSGLDHGERGPFGLRSPIGDPGSPAALAALGREGLVEGTDLTGTPVLAALRKVPGTPWAMVSTIDLEEVYRPLHKQTVFVAAHVALFLLVAGIATVLWWGQLRARILLRHYQGEAERRALEKHLENLVRHANDVILLIDGERRIVEANEKAVTTYGYSREELLGSDVLAIRAPEARGDYDRQVEASRAQGHLLFETVHLRRDGTRLPVEVSSRILEVEGGLFNQSIVRDISERKRAEHQIARLTSLNTALGEINQAIVRTGDRETLYREICRIVVGLGRFMFAWVGTVEEGSGEVRVAAMAGADGGYLDGIRISTREDEPGGRGPTGTAIREGKPYVCGDFFEDPRTVPWREAAARVGVRGNAAFPLRSGDRVVAALTVYASEVGFFDEPTIALLAEIADDISYALGNLDREERRRAAEAALRKSEELLRQSQRLARLGRYELDVATGRWTSSGILDEIFGIGPDELRDVETWVRLVHPDERARMDRYFAEEVLGKKGRFDREYQIVRASDGEVRWVHGLGELQVDPDGTVVRMVGTIQDVTERRRADERFRLWSHVLEGSAEGIFVTDARRVILDVNAAFTEVTGFPAEEAVGATPRLLRSGQHGVDFYRSMWKEIEEKGRWQGEIWNRRKNGEVYPEWLSITAVRAAGGDLTHYVGIFSDITERKQSADRIQYLATHDFLTGLPNRSLMDDLLRQAISNARRKGMSVAVLFLDLDRFKTINDSLGHHAGDVLLQRVAERLGGCVREGDTVSRLGGDEFLVVLPEIGRSREAATVAEKILEAVRAPLHLPEGEVSISSSIGIAVFPNDGEDGVTLVRNADAAMYSAKERGRNNFQFFTPDMNARAFEALAMETSLRRALERNEFVLFYQPQVALESGRITGVEALVRWRHPDLGLVLPGRFIPIAEEHGLIVPIGEWVLRTACRQVRAWIEAGVPAVPVAVNVSALQFRHGNVAERIGLILSETGLSPGYLELELTESIVMREAEATIAVLTTLEGMGVHLSIDDFGTGYSSLSYLRRFPIDRLKIDQSFVRDVTTSPDAQAITAAIISMARSLKLKVIAEGVETEGQLAYLRSQACEEAQGFLFSVPVDAEAAEALLRRGAGLLPGASSGGAAPA